MREGVNFSNYISQGVLLSTEDLRNLFLELVPFNFYNVSSVQTLSDPPLNVAGVLEFYEAYLEKLLSNASIDSKEVQKMFSLALAENDQAFTRVDLPGSRFLLKPSRSVIQWQPLGLFISSMDHEIHTKTFAKEVQSFGIKWSFAQVYEDIASHKITQVGPQDLEWEKLMIFRRFVRHHTEPLQVLRGNETHTYPFRFSNKLKSKLYGIEFFKRHHVEIRL